MTTDHSGLYQTDESWNDPPDVPADIGEMVERVNAWLAGLGKFEGIAVSTQLADDLRALLTDRDELVRKLGVAAALIEKPLRQKASAAWDAEAIEFLAALNQFTGQPK